MLLDVDRLRELNEHRGHAVGDAVLRELAGRLSHSVRTYDTISHVGGGRFAVLVPDLRDSDALRRICDEIAATLTSEPLRSAGREVRVTVSAGGARSHPGTTVDALLHTAELALAAAKRTGPGMQAVRDSRLETPEDETGEAARVAATLARAAAVREGVPHEHECSVAELAELVGRELGLSESLQADLRLAGLLHDVGTIAVAGAVLSKPGPLDEEEWVILREHPSIGADMVARIPGLARTQLAIRHHHERFDGHGYPDRLAGESIPVAARVLAAVDTYNAMTEIRPYRERTRPRGGARGAAPQRGHAARSDRRRRALPRARRPERGRSRGLKYSGLGTRLVRAQPRPSQPVTPATPWRLRGSVMLVDDAARAGGVSSDVATALLITSARCVRSTFTSSVNCRCLPLASTPTVQQTWAPESLPPPAEVTVRPSGSVSQTFTPCAVALPTFVTTSV